MPTDTFRCELTPERLDAGERELALALAVAASRTQEALRPRRDRIEPGGADRVARVPVIAADGGGAADAAVGDASRRA